MASGIIAEYMSFGLIAARPTTPDVGSQGIAFYYATDASSGNELTVYANGAWHSAVALAGAVLAGLITSSGLTSSATSKLIGRKSASGGALEELSISDALDLIGSAAQGDLLYRSASGWARLPAGTSGNFLKTLGAGANPTWAAASGGGGLFDLSAGVPAASSFTNENFLSGTTKGEVSGKAVFLNGTAAGNGSIQLIYTPAPASTPYRVAILAQANFICDTSPDSWPFFGWRDGTGKLHGVLNLGDSWNTQKYNSATSFNSQDSSRVFYDHRGEYWIGLRDNGTNAYWEISTDGVNFAEIFNVTKSGSFLGASGFSNICIGARPNDVQAWSLTVRCYDQNGLTRTFP
jgi:hypothetical protein